MTLQCTGPSRSPARGLHAKLAPAVLMALVTVLVSILPNQAFPATGSPTDKASELYNDVEFQDALELLQTVLLQDDLTPDERRRALVLQARCLVSLNRNDEALAAFCEAIRLDPQWNPDPVAFPADELTVARQAQARCLPVEDPPDLDQAVGGSSASLEQSGGFWNWMSDHKILVVGASVIAAGTIAYVLAQNGDEDAARTVPPFPPPPDQALWAGD